MGCKEVRRDLVNGLSGGDIGTASDTGVCHMMDCWSAALGRGGAIP